MVTLVMCEDGKFRQLPDRQITPEELVSGAIQAFRFNGNTFEEAAFFRGKLQWLPLEVMR